MNYKTSFFKDEYGQYNISVYQQLQYLKEESYHGAAERLQSEYPEGFIFFKVIYGLTWAELIKNLSDKSSIYKEGISEIDKSLKAVQDQQAKQRFQKYLPLKYGAFYRGWTNYLLGKKLYLTYPKNRKFDDEIEFKQNCKDIVCSLKSYDHPFIETYSRSSWPADVIIAMASVNLHDKIFMPEYSVIIKQWLDEVFCYTDINTGLLPHLFDGNDGRLLQGPRGSSLSLLIPFLYEMDKILAQTQFALYKSNFLVQNIGMVCIYEFPKGTSGERDIDSGPVILGVGASATIAAQRTFYILGETKISIRLRNQIEALGFPITLNNKKRFLAGKMLMADVFIAWSNSCESIDIKSGIDGGKTL